MTSIFDQYEEESIQKITKTSKISAVSPELSRCSEFENVELEDSPLFTFQKFKYCPHFGHKIQQICVSNDKIVVAQTNGNILLLSSTSDQIKELDISKYGGKLQNIFLDPIMGVHLLVTVSVTFQTTVTSELYYVHLPFMKLKHLSRMHGHDVTAVAWSFHSLNQHRTGPILLGTSKGLIFEIEIEADSDKLFATSAEQYCKQIFAITSEDVSSSITGLEYHQFSEINNKYFIICTTPSRMYNFIGTINNAEERPLLSQIFNNYFNTPEGFFEIRNNNTASKLQFYYEKSGHLLIPKSFGWHLYKIGILYGKVNDRVDKDASSVTAKNSMIEYCTKKEIPISFVVTEFHVILLYSNRITAMSVLDKEIVCSEYVDEANGKLISISRDIKTGNLWLCSEKLILHCKITKEERFVWKIYLNNDEFELAKQYCSDNLFQFNHCLQKQAEHYFKEKSIIQNVTFTNIKGLLYLIIELCFVVNNILMYEFTLNKMYVFTSGNKSQPEILNYILAHCNFLREKGNAKYEESAELYSSMQCSFEEIALKFLQVSEFNALKLYLMKKLEQLEPTQSTHITMIALWLTEIYINQLAEYRNSKESDWCSDQEIQDDFEQFLSMPQVSACIKANKETVYKLLASYGDMDNLIKISVIHKDFENVVKHYINDKNMYGALLLLNEHMLPMDTMHAFIPEMLTQSPKLTIDLLIKQIRTLNPSSVLQSLIFQYENESQALEVIRYLEYCIHSVHCREEEIHNYLITLYVKYKPDRLMEYLTIQGNEISLVNYDVKYSLRLCQENNLTEACVHLSSLLGLWESAVELALTVKIDLAKQTISQVPHENVELCKKLWLKIARHVVNECNDIKQAMEFLQQCELIKIEDILPFFPDFTTIDNFKDAICSSLQEYNDNIELVKEEMDDAIKSAEIIRSEIQQFKNKYTVIKSTDVCSSCNIQLLLRPFYAFPCNHRFHFDCLICELKPLLSEPVYTRLQHLQRQLANVSSTADNISASSGSLAIKDQIKTEINSIIAVECLFCGTLAINEVDRPFIEEDDFERIKQDWE